MSKQSANDELRNALLLCMRGMCGYCRMDAEARGMSTKCMNGCEALRVAKAALDRKPRNCDRFSNANEALEAFAKEKCETMIEFIRWLYAEAKGEAK